MVKMKEDGLVMRTHTSPVQSRSVCFLEASPSCMCPGRFSAPDALDATHALSSIKKLKDLRLMWSNNGAEGVFLTTALRVTCSALMQRPVCVRHSSPLLSRAPRWTYGSRKSKGGAG